MKQTIINQKDFYTLSDLNLCSTICCYGYELEYIDKNNPSKAVFYIKKDKQLNDLIAAYFRDELRVEPKQFANYIKAIKTRIYRNFR